MAPLSPTTASVQVMHIAAEAVGTSAEAAGCRAVAGAAVANNRIKEAQDIGCQSLLTANIFVPREVSIIFGTLHTSTTSFVMTLVSEDRSPANFKVFP